MLTLKHLIIEKIICNELHRKDSNILQTKNTSVDKTHLILQLIKLLSSNFFLLISEIEHLVVTLLHIENDME